MTNKLAASLALITLFTTVGFADEQLRWLDNEPDAQDAGARIQPGMPYVDWMSHDKSSQARLMVVETSRVQVVPGEGRWEVLVYSTPIAERRGSKWVPLKDAKKELRALDLANVYIPSQRQKAGQQFKNIAHTLTLQTTIREKPFIVVPSGPMNAAIKVIDPIMQKQASKPLMAADMRDDEQLLPQVDADMRDDEQLPPPAPNFWAPVPSKKHTSEDDLSDDEWIKTKLHEATVNRALEATAEPVLTPEQEKAFWDEMGDESLDVMGEKLGDLMQLWADGSEGGEDLLQGTYPDDRDESGEVDVRLNHDGALGALETLGGASKVDTSAQQKITKVDTSALQKVDTSAQMKVVQEKALIGFGDLKLGE